MEMISSATCFPAVSYFQCCGEYVMAEQAEVLARLQARGGQ